MRAFVFPGQGSQHSGMGKDLAQAYPAARLTFEEADQVLGYSISRLCFEGPEEELRLTENTQPAILTCSVAAWRALEQKGISPDFVAGHSLGEYSALVAAGGLSFGDAVRLVHLRGRFMQEAVPVGVGAMAAVIGLGAPEMERVCERAAQGEVVAPANINLEDQVVIAGHAGAVARAGAQARQAGARRVLPLAVSAPFHCELMRPARERLEAAMQEVHFSDLKCPLVNNVDARLVHAAEDVRRGLVRQVTGAVRWIECMRQLTGKGVDTFVEVGPGKVLSGLLRRMDSSLKTLNVETPEQVEAYE